jgi:tetratricopeptide (TPR) repeat protein
MPDASETRAEALKSGGANTTLTQLVEALRQNPQDPEAYVRLGNAYAHFSMPDKAAECFAWAIRLSPQSAALWRALGEAQEQAGRPNDAAASYREALRLDPGEERAHQSLTRLGVEPSSAPAPPPPAPDESTPGVATCLNHPGAAAETACAGCRRPFCPSCLVSLQGRLLCGPCRDTRVARMQGDTGSPTMADQILPVRNPQALTGYYIGVFSLIPCFGLVAGPAALILGMRGLRAVRERPELPGKAHAITATVLGALTTLANWGLLLFGLLAFLLSS